MAPQPAILGGEPAITLDHSYYAQWPIYTEEEVEAVSDLIRNHALASQFGGPGPITDLERRLRRHGASSTPWLIRQARRRCGRRSLASAWHPAMRSSRNRPSIRLTACRLSAPAQCPSLPTLIRSRSPSTPRTWNARLRRARKPSWSSTGPAARQTWTPSWTSPQRHSLRVVEDNCISQGTTHRGRMAGTYRRRLRHQLPAWQEHVRRRGRRLYDQRHGSLSTRRVLGPL